MKKNILFIATFPELTGGNISMCALINYMKRDYNVYVVNTYYSELDIELKKLGVQVFHIKSYQDIYYGQPKILDYIKKYGKQCFNLVGEFKLSQLCKRLSIDLIHINSIASDFGVYTGKQLNIPVIWHVREFVTEDQENYFWSETKRAMQMNQVARNIFISESIKEKFSKWTPYNGELVYNGVNEQLFKINKIFKKKETHITIAGSITKIKGQIQAIEAIELLQKKGYSNIHLHIWGKGHEEYVNSLKQKISQIPYPENIHLEGFTTNLSNIWANTDIGLVCSKQEAFGRVTIEALMSGVVVIGSNTGETPKILKKVGGYIYRYGDIEDLAQKIEEAIEHKDDLIKKMNKQIALTIENFSAKKNYENILSIYRDILN